MPQLRNDVDLASKYTIVKRLNSGSFGDVYLGLDPQGNEVAIKILIGGDDGDPEAIERERYFCQLVDHPNIIKTYDVLEVSGDWWFITQFCAHGDLFGAILPLQGVCDENRTKKYFAQLVDAVAYLHDADIVHRDIKPENCLLTADDDLKLCDFGLSGFESDEWETGIGTFPYMAPEVFQLHRTTNSVHSHKAADVWSVGVTLYTMLKGMLPWDEPCMSDPDYEVFRENRGRFEVSGWSEDLHELFAGMLHWDPLRRLTIHEVQDKLIDMLHSDWVYGSNTENIAAPINAAMGRMDSDLRRPRSPPGQSDYIFFGMDDAIEDRHDNAASDTEQMRFGEGFEPGKLLPPKRRTRYDSELLEIEFNPYVDDDQMYVVRRTADSDTSDEGDTDDDGSWFKAGSMSFSTLPKFGNEDSSPSASAQPPVTSASRPRFTFGAADDSCESEGEDLDGRNDDSHPSAEPRDSGLSLGFEGRSWADLDRDMSFSVLPRFDSLKIGDAAEPASASSPAPDTATPLASRVRFAKAAEAAEQSQSSDDSSDDSGLGVDIHAGNRNTANVPSVMRSGSCSAVSSRPPSALGMRVPSQHV